MVSETYIYDSAKDRCAHACETGRPCEDCVKDAIREYAVEPANQAFLIASLGAAGPSPYHALNKVTEALGQVEVGRLPACQDCERLQSEFGQRLDKAERKIEGQLRAALTCAEARKLKIEELERNRLALGRKLRFIKRATEEAIDAGRFFDRHYRGNWDHNRWLQFLRTSFKNRAETRCVARCPFDSKQCTRGLGHYGSHESGECSWRDEWRA